VFGLPITGSWLSDLAIITIPFVILAMALDRDTVHGLVIRRVSQVMLVLVIGYAIVSALIGLANGLFS
jgi:hypothetical protein